MTLLEWKEENRFTFKDIKNMLNVEISGAMLSYIFNGDRPASIRLMRKLKEVTGLSLDEIIGGYNENNKNQNR